MQCIATASVEFHEAVKMDLLLNLASALLRGTDWKSIRTQEIVWDYVITHCDRIRVLLFLWQCMIFRVLVVVQSRERKTKLDFVLLQVVCFHSGLYHTCEMKNRVSLISTTVEVKFPFTRLSDLENCQNSEGLKWMKVFVYGVAHPKLRDCYRILGTQQLCIKKIVFVGCQPISVDEVWISIFFSTVESADCKSLDFEYSPVSLLVNLTGIVLKV